MLNQLDKKVDTSSKNLFVDLVNSNDSVINKLVLNAAALHTAGSITLNDSLPTGNYWLRCYTQKIIVNNPASAGIKLLYVVNRRTNAPLPPAGEVAPLQPLIRFYPEGGTPAQGTIVASDGSAADSTVCSFTTNRFGLAKISLYPVWFKKYKAVIKVNGNNITYPLPAYNPYAIQLSVAERSASNIQVHVAMEDSVYSRRFITYLLVVNGGHVYFAAVGRGMYTHDVPLDNMPGGVTTWLLFNDKEQLISSRKIFINKPNYSIEVKAGKANYTARDNVHLDIDTKDAAGNPLIAELNVSVQDNRIMQVCDELQEDSIMPPTGEGLNEWLKRYGANLAAGDIDLFMLAQQPAAHNDSMPKSPVEESAFLLQNLVGKVTGKKNIPLKDKVVTVMMLAKTGNFFGVDTTRDDGSFAIPIKRILQGEPLQVQVSNKRNLIEDANISIDTFKFPLFTTPAILKMRHALVNALPARQLQKYTTDTFYNYIGKGWLKPVTVTAVAKAKPNYDVSKRLSPFSHIVTNDVLGHGGAGMVGNAVLSVPGISTISGRVVIRGPSGSQLDEPLLVIDGVAVRIGDDSAGSSSPLLNYLNTLDHETIDFIEVLEGPEAAIYGSRASNGVVSVVTKFPDNKNYGPGFKVVRPVVYHTAAPFDMPDYADKKIKANKTPDPRTTIYWQGNIVTTPEGRAVVNFFAADEPATYTVVVTGITLNGESVYKRITVNRQ